MFQISHVNDYQQQLNFCSSIGCIYKQTRLLLFTYDQLKICNYPIDIYIGTETTLRRMLFIRELLHLAATCC